jgi:ferredoxin-NADP reductase
MRKPALVILALAALGACSEKPADPRGVERDEVLLQVVASGRVDTRPDEARFSAGVQTNAATAAAASAGNNEVMTRVAAALERLGVKEDDLQTRRSPFNGSTMVPERGPVSRRQRDRGPGARHEACGRGDSLRRPRPGRMCSPAPT